jgi:hypothetical protein
MPIGMQVRGGRGALKIMQAIKNIKMNCINSAALPD